MDEILNFDRHPTARIFDRALIHKLASAAAAADKSDPFVYRRAVSHMLSGVAGVGDYDRSARP